MLCELLNLLLRVGLAWTPALLVYLPLRPWLRTRVGAPALYLAWSVLPALAAVAALGPYLPQAGAAVSDSALQALSGAELTLLVRSERGLPAGVSWAVLWAAGASLAALWLGFSQWRLVRRLGPLQAVGPQLWRSAGQDGPMLLGVFKPRIVIPSDFEQRFTPRERELILAHERQHWQRGDLLANAMWALARCLFWFHPLVHWGAMAFRLDQELACDAAVLARHGQPRRSYAEALLKTVAVERAAPLACAWNHVHPMFLRIGSLRAMPTSPSRVALFVLLALAAGAIAVAWQSARHGPQFVALDQVAAQADGRFDLRIRQDEDKAVLRIGRLAGVTAGQRLSLPAGDCETVLDVLQPALMQLRLLGHIRCDGSIVARPDLRITSGASATLEWQPRPGAPPRHLTVRATRS